MAYVEKKIYSGDYLEIERYKIYDKENYNKEYVKRSDESQRKLNWKNSEKKLRRLMNCNFIDGQDLFLTLTFIVKLDLKAAKREFQSFIKRLKYFRNKNKMKPLKYISCVGEDKKTGIHFHMCINKIALDDLGKIWKKSALAGRFHISTLSFDSQNGLGGLARYFMANDLEINKNKNDSLENYNKRLGKKWSHSQNLKKPIIKKKRIKTLSISTEPPQYKLYKTVNFETIATPYGVYQYVEMVRIKRRN